MQVNKRGLSLVLTLTVGAGGFSMLPAAHAQEGAALEEIVVTARKREETLAEIPMAITAFSADQLERGGYTSLQDLSFQTAGMHFHKQGGQIPGRSPAAAGCVFAE